MKKQQKSLKLKKSTINNLDAMKNETMNHAKGGAAVVNSSLALCPYFVTKAGNCPEI